MEKNILNIQALFTWFKEKTPRLQSLSEATKAFGLHCECPLILKIVNFDNDTHPLCYVFMGLRAL